MPNVDLLLRERLATLIQSMGLELVGVESVTQGRQMIFRIYIDGPNGVTADDCSRVSHQVSAMLDVEAAFQSRYTLEVSSPGIDRPLFELDHYRRFIGSKVKIRLHMPINQRRQFKGLLKRVENEDIYVLIDDTDEEICVSINAIEKANVIGNIRL